METVPVSELGWNDSRRDTTSKDNHFAVNHFDGIVGGYAGAIYPRLLGMASLTMAKALPKQVLGGRHWLAKVF